MRWPTISKKAWIATALVAAASLGSVAIYRVQRNRQRAAAKAEKDRAKAARVDNSYRERIAILQFTEALRAELAWHQASPRPATESAHRQHLAELAARMRKLSVSLLPADIANPWKNLQSAWAQLADSPHPSPELIRTGSKAAAELNAALAARGFPDFHF
ncbi:MAG: hypothetical protein RLZZ179_1467 [Verrucomicrobiota bacterium]|jgi:hypothetical protein